MNRIDPQAVLPVFHDRIPARADEGTFLSRLQAPALPQAEAQPDPEKRVVVATEAASAPAELYELAGVALNRLSFLAASRAIQPRAEAPGGLHGKVLEPAEAAPSPQRADGATAAPVQTGSEPVVTGLNRMAPLAVTAAEESEATASAGREPVPEAWLRKMRLYAVDEGVELVLRIDGTGPEPQVVTTLREYCRREQIALARIVLNGHVAWSRT